MFGCWTGDGGGGGGREEGCYIRKSYAGSARGGLCADKGRGSTIYAGVFPWDFAVVIQIYCSTISLNRAYLIKYLLRCVPL